VKVFAAHGNPESAPTPNIDILVDIAYHPSAAPTRGHGAPPMTFSATSTVGSIVADRPSAARIFERFGIDYCCGGRRPLQEACAAKGLDARAVLDALAAETAGARPDERDWSGVSLSDLADHIEQSHHAYLKRELPRLHAMSRKVAGVHGEAHPEYAELAREYEVFATDMLSHMNKEERVLFPWIRRLERGEAAHSGVAAPIGVMEHEHDDSGRSLERMSALTGGFTAPPGACATTRALIDSLRQLKDDTHLHVHKENNILFPRALQMDAAAPDAACAAPEAHHGHLPQCQARPRV
jgi:regulator of cell morphogenesis and NO signaling